MDLLALQISIWFNVTERKFFYFWETTATQVPRLRTPGSQNIVWSFFKMDVLLSSYLTMDIDSDKESHFTHHGAARNPTLLTMDFRNGWWGRKLVFLLFLTTILLHWKAYHVAPAVGTGCGQTMWYHSQDRKHRPGWHYLRMLLRLVFCLLVRISLYCPAGFPPWPQAGDQLERWATGVASLQSDSTGWCAAGRCGKSAWLMQPCGASKVLPSTVLGAQSRAYYDTS